MTSIHEYLANNPRLSVHYSEYDNNSLDLVWDDGGVEEETIYTGSYSECEEFIRSNFNGS